VYYGTATPITSVVSAQRLFDAMDASGNESLSEKLKIGHIGRPATIFSPSYYFLGRGERPAARESYRPLGEERAFWASQARSRCSLASRNYLHRQPPRGERRGCPSISLSTSHLADGRPRVTQDARYDHSVY
jgi:hypothetical protein